uniref:Uncharacterized protein n=1 Tax=Picea sitchensis TaxID=3332 RepID=A9P293_PICSI|nr:unknown [Picea sitchensis]
MEFPQGRQPHNCHQDHEEERREQQHHHHGFQPSPVFPRPSSAGEYYPPPGTQFPEPGYYPPPPPPQPYSQVEHHAHQPFSQGEEPHAHQGFGHVIHHESHHPFQRPECETPSGSFPRPSCGSSENSFTRPGYGPPGGSFPRPEREPVLPRGQVVRVFTKANPDFSLAIRNGSAVLVHANAHDKHQQWVNDETYSTKVKDEANCPSFSLVNKATGQALKHGLGETQPVLLTEYQLNTFDESILWTMSGDMGQGYRTIRLVNNIHLNLDAFHGDKKSGGIKDGNPVVLWSWKKGDNQLWKIVPY